MLLDTISMAQCQSKNKEGSASNSQSNTAKAEDQQGSEFPCLPDEVTLKDVVTYSRKADKNVTVKDKLIEIKARCEDGKLVDSNHKEIRFFRLQCWGNPPADYQGKEQRQQDELKELQKKYTVIVMGCNPFIE
jgi:hypothetical protein